MNSRNHLVILLLSMSLIALEMAWTRIFSAEFFYTFAFLVLSLAVMGLGFGALAVRMAPGLARPRLLGGLLIVTAVLALGAPVLVFEVSPDFTRAFGGGAALWELVAVILLVNLPFFAGGMALAAILRADPEKVPGLYAADLFGAGIGVLGIVALMNAIGTPAAVFWLPVPLLLGALLTGGHVWRAFAVVLVVVSALLAPRAPDLLRADREPRAPIIYEHWDAAAKVKVYDFAPDHRGLEIDNVANSPLIGFDGNWDRPDSLRYEFGIDVSYLMDRFDDCRFLSLGAGGGGDVMQALQANCTEVHAVEVVPHVNRMMQEGEYAEFTGGIYNDPRVIVATEDARAYARRHRESFDIIYSLSSNSWAALASGSFALSESYLFTTEAFRDYWRALRPGGFLSMEHQFYWPRLVSSLRDALEAEGVADPLAHFAVYDLKAMRRTLVLVSKEPLTEEIIYNAYGEITPEVYEYITVLHPPQEGEEDRLIPRILRNGWAAEQDSVAIDLSPATDDRPFAAQLGLWKNFSWDTLERVSPYEFMGYPLAKLLILMITAVVAVIGLPLTFLPLLRSGPRLRPLPWLFFFLIGFGFMAVEVVLIQQLTLLVGLPLAAIVTVLTTLLFASAAGSALAPRIRPLRALPVLVALLLLFGKFAPLVIDAAGGLSQIGRIFVAVLLTAPFGLVMGVPFPSAARRVGELVDWGLAVNGVGSVLGSALVILVAITQGFNAAFLIAATCYILAWLCFYRREAW